MRNIFLILIIVGAQLLSACSDWLDVKPKTDVDIEDHYNSKEGFEAMLNGVYIAMASENLYGKELSYGSIEMIAQNHYDNESKWLNWNYEETTVKAAIEKIWLDMYNCISNVNSILDNVDSKSDLFDEDDYNIIKGEALALRAFLHFDILRLYGDSYAEDTKDKISMPYVFKHGIARYAHISASKVYEYILEDLNQAEELLLKSDPIINDSYSGDLFTELKRKYHLNYYSVLALKARVCITKGDKENALTYAENVIRDFSWNWVTEDKLDAKKKDVLFFSEVVSALNVRKLSDYYDQYFANTNTVYTTYGDNYPHSKLIFEVEKFKWFQPFPGPGGSDWRYTYQFRYDNNAMLSISDKYQQDAPIIAENDNVIQEYRAIPLFRITEMMLIAAEASLGINNEKAIKYINDIKTQRRVVIDNDLSSASETEIMNVLLKEARKEFYLEGQIFYMYKRLRLSQIPCLDRFFPTKNIARENYIFPLPDNEKEFGNIPK